MESSPYRQPQSLNPCQAVRGSGKQPPIFLHFSSVDGERVSADAERDPRVFALKFYRKEGNWDVMRNNTPVFICDLLKFPDFIHTQKRDPRTYLKSPRAMWHFWSLSTESLHQVTLLFSDRVIPDGTPMHGFGSHTYSLINAEGERHWVEWHCTSMRRIRNLAPGKPRGSPAATPTMRGGTCSGPSSGANTRDGGCMQVMGEAPAASHPREPVRCHQDGLAAAFPTGGRCVSELSRNPLNDLAEVEQATFALSNVVPGVG